MGDIRLSGLALCGVLVSHGAFADVESELQRQCQRIVDEAVSAGEQGAVQFCAYRDGKCIVDVWAGSMSTNAGAARVDGTTLFPIYSTEKPVLATAVHRAVEQGLMQYEKPLSTWWPEFVGDGKENLTLGLTLGYRSGLPPRLDPKVFRTAEEQCDWKRICDWAARVKPELPPGTVQRYMSLSYGWYLGHPLEVAYGKPLKVALDDLVLRPAGIADGFFFSAGDAEMPRIATIYGNENFERMNEDIRRRMCLPSAYAVANARSIAKFYNRLCGYDGEAPLVRRETLEAALVACRHPSDPLPKDLDTRWQMVFGKGYGLWGESSDLSRVFGHGGFGGSEGLCDRSQRLTVGFTCNFCQNFCPVRSRLYALVGLKWRYWKDAQADIQSIQMRSSAKTSSPLSGAGEVTNVCYVAGAEGYRAKMCRLDFRYPVAETGFPTVVWFHGGGLTGGRRGYIPLCSPKIAQITADYRLMDEANGVRGEDCIRDAAAAVAWALDHVAQYGGDPKRVYVCGKSAGGYLTMMVGMAPEYLGEHGYRPTDLAGLVPVSGQATKHFNVRKFAGDDDPQWVPKIDRLAPLAHVSADLPPIVSVCGQPPYEWKCRAEENRLLIASCVALGHKFARYVEAPLCDHGRVSPASYPYIEMFVLGKLP